MSIFMLLGFLTLCAILVGVFVNSMKGLAKVKYIQDYQFPELALNKWKKSYPSLSDEKALLVQEALKQFFMIYVKSIKMKKKANFDMPSKVVDDLWHEFILCSREYHSFCETAFGRYFHHNPHPPVQYTNLRGKKLSNGLLNTYRATSCVGNSAWMIGAVPLLFMIDEMVDAQDGFLYDPASIATQLETAKANIATSSGSNCGTYAMFGGDSDGCDSSSSSSCGGGGGCGD